MTDETIVAVYDTAAHAEAAVAGLRAANVPANAISQHAGTAASSGSAAASQPAREQGFWSGLFGGEPDHDTSVYERSVQGGSTVVSVRVPDAHVDGVMQILESHHPIDIDDRAASYGATQTTTTTRTPLATAVPPPRAATAGTTVADGGTIQLAEETLAVGKRVINRGGTRIRRFVVETPVEQSVTLHDEKVTLERRPVTDGRPVTGADFSEKTVEMTATAEEAVVAKTARIKEEIGLRKEATERVETVRDTVRREDVEIEQIPGERVSTGATTPVTPGTPVTPRTPKV